MPAASGRLETYRRKRDFTATPEPAGRAVPGQGGPPVFTVQMHAARRLHYDFRLEWQGVLLSWAVTRGPSGDPAAKRLAVRTEDHPLDYQDFEGSIPEGQYGGGTVLLWDKGWWEPTADVAEGLAKGSLKFRLHGQRMQGGWALVRMKPRKGEKRENWLLIKERDEAAEEGEEALVDRHATSVASGRSLEEIARGKQPAPARKAKSRSRPAKSRLTLKTPAFARPQLAKLVERPPAGDRWLHETKFDGYRCLAALGEEGVRLFTRSGLDWTERFTGLPEAFAALDCRSALIDGEVLAGSGGGGSAFSALQADLEAGLPLRFVAFDLLQLDGEDLRRRPLVERKAALQRLIAGGPTGGPLFFSDHVVGNGAAVFEAVTRAGGEGIVSKLVDSPYAGSRSGSWVKVKAIRRQEFVIGGTSPTSARGRPFASLLVGTREKGRLIYRGRVGGGFSAESLERVEAALKGLGRKTCPFEAVPPEVARGARWVAPRLVAEVSYAEITDQGMIRHGVFQGLREDKEAAMVAMEKPEAADEAGEKVLGVGISSAGRVVFPDAGCTKGDLARYYGAAAERLLAEAGGRPLSLYRCPRGIEGDCFFQKHAGKGFPDAVESLEIEESSGERALYMVVRRKAGFVAAAQMGAIEFHIWGARSDALEKPDRLVFDLDPDEGLAFAEVRKAARAVREVLGRVGLDSVPMVTGGKGVHVIVPLRRTVGWETLTLFSRTLAQHFAEAWPERYVAGMAKAKRKGRIFIDWLRNERGATAVAPYSVRARPGAPVAVPVTWEELSRLKAASAFDMAKARARLDRPCPLQAVPRTQAIGAATLEALERELDAAER